MKNFRRNITALFIGAPMFAYLHTFTGALLFGLGLASLLMPELSNLGAVVLLAYAVVIKPLLLSWVGSVFLRRNPNLLDEEDDR